MTASGVDAGGEVSLLYRGARALTRAALNTFYRTIEVTGREHIDVNVPTIIACNHPNSIIDPLLLSFFEDRQVCFCARDGLFRIPGFGALLRAVGAIPLQRRSDHANTKVDNEGAFAACRALLLRGGVLAIFPEGKTHSRLRVEPLKTGTARIAIDALRARPELPLQVVPVGITYLVRHAFLSDVHVAVGKPIEVASVLAHSDDAVRDITTRLEHALRSLAVHIESREDERLIAQVTSIVAGIRADEGLDPGGQSPAERTAFVQRVLDAYRWAMETDPEGTQALRERIEAYVNERAALGLGGERPALQHRGERRRFSGWCWGVFLVLGAPVALYGLLVSLVPYVMLRSLLVVARLPTYRAALFKLLGGVAVFSLFWALAALLVAQRSGVWIALALWLTFLPAALFAHRYVTETRLHRVQLRSLDAWLQRARVARLRGERNAISGLLAEMRHRYLRHVDAREAR